MAQLYSIVNPHQPGTLPIYTVQNMENDRDCIAVNTRGGKQIIDPPMSSGVEDEVRRDDVIVEFSGELLYKSGKKVEIPQKVTPVPRPPPLFPQRLVKKIENDKY